MAEPPPADAGIQVAVDIDVQAMLDSRANTDELVRELQLTFLDSASESRPDVVALAGQLQRANEEFHEPRRQMYNQTVSAARHHNTQTTLHLSTPTPTPTPRHVGSRLSRKPAHSPLPVCCYCHHSRQR